MYNLLRLSETVIVEFIQFCRLVHEKIDLPLSDAYDTGDVISGRNQGMMTNRRDGGSPLLRTALIAMFAALAYLCLLYTSHPGQRQNLSEYGHRGLQRLVHVPCHQAGQ